MPLKIHFLNVGRGDCTFIEFPSGRIAMVDIDNLKILDDDTAKEVVEDRRKALGYAAGPLIFASSPYAIAAKVEVEAGLTDPFEYYTRQIDRDDIFRVIITHPDMDHMTGLKRLDSERSIANFWHIGDHDFNLDDAVWDDCPYDEEDWKAYKRLRASTLNTKSLQMERGRVGQYWTEDGVELWAPTPDLVKQAVHANLANIASMIIKITYMGRTIILGGDATSDEVWPTIYPITDMRRVDILKASHHGRKSGYHQLSVKEMSPWLTITSVWDKEHDATELYRQYSEYTVSMRQAGDIQITIDDSGTLHYPAKIEDHWKPKKT